MMRNGDLVGALMNFGIQTNRLLQQKISTGKQGFDLQKRVFPVNEF
jgi:hypothetical protein